MSLPTHQTGASEADLAAAEATGLVTFGSHTWSHANLARLSAKEITDELMRPFAWLRSRFAATVPWVSYPYGLRTAAVERAAHDLRFEGGFLIRGGWITDRKLIASNFALPRLNVPAGITLQGFEIRTAGLVIH
jgi:peptidoglycan/xylan/chitin deacetylase (PgdA/CDA1 family)